MTLFTIDAPQSGPVANRLADLVIPGTQVAFGGFTTLIGRISGSDATHRDSNDLDVYLVAMTDTGLQLARVGINYLNNWNQYAFWAPDIANFTSDPPNLSLKDTSKIYLPGTFSSGSIFYSTYFHTFIMVYFNKMTDSTFYIRYLDIGSPLRDDKTWVQNGRNGQGIMAEDVEAIIFYPWSEEQKLYTSPTGLCLLPCVSCQDPG